MKNFINLSEINKNELRKIIDNAKSQKRKKIPIKSRTSLAGKTLKMIFAIKKIHLV